MLKTTHWILITPHNISADAVHVPQSFKVFIINYHQEEQRNESLVQSKYRDILDNT